jgi:UDPglucose--hexose-1-phosphate uridylyltransferase
MDTGDPNPIRGTGLASATHAGDAPAGERRPMYKRELLKPDGRKLLLYGRAPIPEDLDAPSPSSGSAAPNAHLRWHPLRGEWVAYATHRQARTFLPPPEYDPLAPTVDPANPTELPSGQYDVAVFENLFPTLVQGAHDPPSLVVETRPGTGVCEVVVFTQDARTSLGALPLDQIELIFDVWADRYRELGAVDEIQYVFPFENRGVEVGVTLPHPHGQIYAYPFVPPLPARELEQQRQYLATHGRGLLEDLVRQECEDGRRLLCPTGEVVAFVPVCARYPYEVWIAPQRPAASIADLTADERRQFARVLKTVLMKFDSMWGIPFPYILVWHQAPTDGVAHPEAHVHCEIYPAYRMRGRLKYLAGSELGGLLFRRGIGREDTGAELRAVEARVE